MFVLIGYGIPSNCTIKVLSGLEVTPTCTKGLVRPQGKGSGSGRGWVMTRVYGGIDQDDDQKERETFRQNYFLK